jgi:PhnB protein
MAPQHTSADGPAARPYLFVDGAADAIAFYERAFGARERLRLEVPGGKLAHAEVQIGDSVIALCDPLPDFVSRSPAELGGTTAEVLLYVDDVDGTVDAAVNAGATLTVSVTDKPWGDRSGIVTDPFGQVWLVATHVEDVTPEEIAERMRPTPDGS